MLDIYCHNTSPIQNNAFFWFNRLHSKIRTPLHSKLHSTPRLHSMTPLRKLHGAIYVYMCGFIILCGCANFTAYIFTCGQLLGFIQHTKTWAFTKLSVWVLFSNFSWLCFTSQNETEFVVIWSSDIFEWTME